MKVALGVLVLILASACSSDSGAPKSDPTPTPSPRATKKVTPPGSDIPPRKRLEAAQLALARTRAGAYELDVYLGDLDHAVVTELGRFDVVKEVLDVVRTVQEPSAEEGEASSYVMWIRSSARTRFLQMEDWGAWEGCWAELDPELQARLGVDLTGLPNIPSPVSLVLDARLPARNRPALDFPGGAPSVVPAASTSAGEELTVSSDGVTALQMLGVGGRMLFDVDPAVARAAVPVTLTFFYNHPDIVERVYVDGLAVARALRATEANLDPELMAWVEATRSFTTFSHASTPVEFRRPPADELLPRGATSDQTCPANLD